MEPNEEMCIFSTVIVDNVKIKPWSFGQLFLISPYLEKYKDKIKKIEINNKLYNFTLIVKLLSCIDKNLKEIIKISTGLTYKTIEDLDIETGIKLSLVIYDQNKKHIENKKRTKPFDDGSAGRSEGKSERRTDEGISLTIFDLFYSLLKNNIGKSLDDLKWNYTIDQIYILYDKCIKDSMDTNRMTAIVMAQALAYTSPKYSKGDGQKSTKNWNKFLDSLDWRTKHDAKELKSPKEIKNIFGRLGVPVKQKK